MTDNAYTKTDVLEMESFTLKVMEFNFTFPTSLSFLQTYMYAIKCTD